MFEFLLSPYARVLHTMTHFNIFWIIIFNNEHCNGPSKKEEGGKEKKVNNSTIQNLRFYFTRNVGFRKFNPLNYNPQIPCSSFLISWFLFCWVSFNFVVCNILLNDSKFGNYALFRIMGSQRITIGINGDNIKIN